MAFFCFLAADLIELKGSELNLHTATRKYLGKVSDFSFKKGGNYIPVVTTSRALSAFDLATAAACHCNLIGRRNVWISRLRVQKFQSLSLKNPGFDSG